MQKMNQIFWNWKPGNENCIGKIIVHKSKWLREKWNKTASCLCLQKSSYPVFWFFEKEYGNV